MKLVPSGILGALVVVLFDAFPPLAEVALDGLEGLRAHLLVGPVEPEMQPFTVDQPAHFPKAERLRPAPQTGTTRRPIPCMREPMAEPLHVFLYASSRGAWIQDLHACAPARGPAAITVITWNTWFAPYSFNARFKALLALLHARRPDVVCLQEIVAESLALLLAEPWIRADYRISDARGTTFESYGVVILSRLPVLALGIHELPSSMSRRLLVAEVAVGPRRLVIATAHLESLKPGADTRADQLAEIFPRLRALGPDTVFTGDFNFCSSSREENANLDAGFVDLWPALRGGAPGYTEDTGVNTMLANVNGDDKTVRYDRILLRSEAGAWKPRSIELLGTSPIAPTSPDVFPSDHFGLVAEIEAR